MEEGIYHTDCTTLLTQIAPNTVNLIVTDPPFNINYQYDIYQDKQTSTKYVEWTNHWIDLATKALAPNGSIYVCIGDEYAAETNLALKHSGLFQRGWIVWRYGFGVQCKKKYQRCHTHIHYFVKHKEIFTFNADPIRVPSDRQIKYNDKRADPRGKIPPDVWDFPRLCGTFKSRILTPDGKSAHPCQMNEAVIQRCILASSNPGDLVVDPFCGSGTTAHTAHLLGRRFITSDISENYCKLASSRVFGTESSYRRL